MTVPPSMTLGHPYDADTCSPILADLIVRERLRTRIEAAVAWLIDTLDAIDAPAEDLEPSLGYYRADAAYAVDAEETNEDGGDINDEPHDGNTEDDLGWDDDSGIADEDGAAEQNQRHNGRLGWSAGGYIA